MKIRIAQINTSPGDISGNSAVLTDIITQSKREGIDLLIFPALSICGTNLQDLPHYKDFREACGTANHEIAALADGIRIIFGGLSDEGETHFTESVFVAQGANKLLGVPAARQLKKDFVKSGAPDFWDESVEAVELENIKIGILKHDWLGLMSREENFFEQNGPAPAGFPEGVDVYLLTAAAPFQGKTTRSRTVILEQLSAALGKPVLFVNQSGGNTSLICDGASQLVDSAGGREFRLDYFTEAVLDIEFDPGSRHFREPKSTQSLSNEPEWIELKFRALVTGLRDYLKKTKAATKVTLGLSGGIDSALVCAIAVEALGSENVIGITMPSHFSSKGSVSDSKLLADNLGIEFREIPIAPIYDAFLEQLKPHFEDRPFDVAEENIQSRSRGDLLMSMANKFGYMVLAPGNKSELAVGYCTLYGDMVGGLAVIGDLYKTEVFEMCRWLNKKYYSKETIPAAIINKAPSAELRPDQKDTDSLPSYEILDGVLQLYFDDFASRREIVAAGYDSEVVDKILRLVDFNEHKRRQAAPVIKLSNSAFGVDRRWPSVQGWTLQRHRFE